MSGVSVLIIRLNSRGRGGGRGKRFFHPLNARYSIKHFSGSRSRFFLRARYVSPLV